MNGNMYPALGSALVSLVIGVGLLLIVIFRAPKFFNTINTICWLLIALVPVFPLFAIFPDSSFSLKIRGVSATGAIAAFLYIWLKGMKITKEAYNVDQLNATIKERDDEIKELIDKARRPKEAEHERFMYTLKNGKKLGLITGDIVDVTGVDIWVSSENTNMEMARFFDRSVSAAIRYNGSKRGDGGKVIVERDQTGKITFNGDLIAEELTQKKGDEFYVQPASVYVTGPGELLTKGVKQIFHVAAVHGTPSDGYAPVPNLDHCVTHTLQKAEDFKDLGYKSILLPLLATGTARGELKPISRLLIRTAVTYLETKASVIETLYFLAWSDIDRDTCKEILTELQDRVTPDKP